jgi:hypothetical protein
MFKGLDTQLKFNTTYHPYTDGKDEITNQILEDMLRMYVMNRTNKWEEYLHLVEFTSNNHYEDSTKHIPFQILYGIKCNTPISWRNHVNILMIGPEMLK